MRDLVSPLWVGPGILRDEVADSLPFFKLYPGDWRKNTGIQCLTYEHKGILTELLCFLHESEDRGRLVQNGVVITDDAIARLLGLDKQNLTIALTSIFGTGWIIREEGGAIVCPWMLHDEKIRRIRADCGKKGGNPKLLVKQNPTKYLSKSVNMNMNMKSVPDSVQEGESEGGELGLSGFAPNVKQPRDSAMEIIAWLNHVACRKFTSSEAYIKAILPRLAEVNGDVEGVKQMIARQVAIWQGTDMERYLDPITLFRPSNFPKYYDQRDLPIFTGKENNGKQTGNNTHGRPDSQGLSPRESVAADRNKFIVGADATKRAIEAETAQRGPKPWDNFAVGKSGKDVPPRPNPSGGDRADPGGGVVPHESV